jgi:hypothetical protein
MGTLLKDLRPFLHTPLNMCCDEKLSDKQSGYEDINYVELVQDGIRR